MTEITKQEFAEKLKRFRERNEITQFELAEQLGTSVRNVESWESGRFKPRSIALRMILKMIDDG